MTDIQFFPAQVVQSFLYLERQLRDAEKAKKTAKANRCRDKLELFKKHNSGVAEEVARVRGYGQTAIRVRFPGGPGLLPISPL